MPLNTVKYSELECEYYDPGQISAARPQTSLESHDHNSTPLVPSLAEKYSLPLNSVRCLGFEDPDPGLMSATRVHESLESHDHSS